MDFKLCDKCKRKFERDRKYFCNTTICGKCAEAREEFFKVVHENLKEAFYFSFDPGSVSPMSLCHALEKNLNRLEKEQHAKPN